MIYNGKYQQLNPCVNVNLQKRLASYSIPTYPSDQDKDSPEEGGDF